MTHLVRKAIYILGEGILERVYGPDEQRDIAALVSVTEPAQTAVSIKQNLSLLRDVEIILSSWGCPVMDRVFLEAAPSLKVVFYGAGSVRGFVTPEFWERGIVLSCAWAANAVPVTEYTLSQILFCLKHGWQDALATKQQGRLVRKEPVPGAYGSTVGIISLGMIGRRVCELLRGFDVKVLAYDPYATADVARRLNVTLCSLDEVFARSDVVSLHTPWLKETENMITGRHFSMMKPGASFINTARGAVVNEPEMITVLTQRPDIFAVLDVTHPEPPVPGSPLFSLPNVVLTPHIAGSMDSECRRMGRFMVDELKRYLNGEPLQWQITRERAETLA